MSTAQGKKPKKAALVEALMEMPMTLRVMLGHSSLKGRDLLNLGAGDIIQLDCHRKALLPVYIEDKLLFLGAPKLHNNKIVVIVQKVFDDPK